MKCKSPLLDKINGDFVDLIAASHDSIWMKEDPIYY